MNRKGYTLVELLAIISILAVVMIFFIPYMLRVFYNTKNMLNDYMATDLKDSVKAYLADYDLCVKEYVFKGGSYKGLDKTYKNGDKMSCYDFKTYVADQGGELDINIKTLVEEGYYNDGCTYGGTGTEKDKGCQISSNCVVTGIIKTEKAPATNYLITKDYDAKIGNDCVSVTETDSDFMLTSYDVTTNKIVINFNKTSEITGVTCKYGTTSDNMKSASISGNACTLSNLINSTKYYYELCATTKKGENICRSGSKKTEDFISPLITLESTPAVSINKYVKSETATIQYEYLNKTSAIKYYFKTDRNATVKGGTVTGSCGTADIPSKTCSSSSVTSITSGVWYTVSTDDVKIEYSGQTQDKTGTLFATIYDGVNFSPYTSAITKRLDNTSPILNLNSTSSRSDTLILYYDTSDDQSGVKSIDCSYGTSESNLTTYSSNSLTENSPVDISLSSCKISGLKKDTTYYYKICSEDSLGNNKTCINGNVKTTAISQPTFTHVDNPENAKDNHSYLKSQRVFVNYNVENLLTSYYFIKVNKNVTIEGATANATCNLDGNGGCTNLSTPTTSLTNGTWYRVTGNLNILFSEHDTNNITIYAMTSDDSNSDANKEYNNSPRATYVVNKIDTVAPYFANSPSSVVSTKEVTISFKGADLHSGIGDIYGALMDSSGKVISETSGYQVEKFVFGRLKDNTLYSFKICLKDTVGNGATTTAGKTTYSVCETGNFKTNAFKTPVFKITNTPETSIGGFVVNSEVNVEYPLEAGLKYYFKSSAPFKVKSGTISYCDQEDGKPVTDKCFVNGDKEIEGDTWYKVSDSFDIIFEEPLEENAVIYALVYDDYNLSGASTAVINKIFYLASNATYIEGKSVEEAIKELYGKLDITKN